MHADYQPQSVETEVQRHWEENKTFKARENPTQEKFYCLSMIPYTSGKLHMGHVRNYTLSDVVARYHRLQGKNVLHPIGWDAFGLPAENAALQNQSDPATWTYTNIQQMREQLKQFGFSYDWEREIITCDPNYYRWEQWLFIQLYQRGLVYKKCAHVNWCPQDQTVLANEQVVDGRCWRCDTPVVQKTIPQWFIKITAYAEQLLQDLEQLSGWPAQVKSMQQHWIGRSSGIEIDFTLIGHGQPLTVYTTRPDTIYGVVAIVLAAEHPLAIALAATSPEIAAFIAQCRQIKVAEAALAALTKVGIETPLQAVHPFTGAYVPIWITNFILASYGSGAAMVVPAHDERDYQFAIQYQLPIQRVIQPHAAQPPLSDTVLYTGTGTLVNSGPFDGLTLEQAQHAVIEQLVQRGQGRRATHFRLRDWGVSRQRYWGAPIPMVSNAAGEVSPLPEDQLPLNLPKIDALHSAHNPLQQPKWRATSLHGVAVQRECDTFDTFVESSWYYARNTCPQLTTRMLDPQAASYWLPIDHYTGGIEHATMHLIYCRFFHKLLRDLGLVEGDEPIKRLLCQGMVLADAFYTCTASGERIWLDPTTVKVERDAQGTIIHADDDSGRVILHAGMCKMSKSKNNGIDSQKMVTHYGADTLRLFMMFAAPPELTLEWQTHGVEGAHRFLKRLWRAVHQHVQQGTPCVLKVDQLNAEQKKLRATLHRTIRRVTDDIEQRQSFNTAVAAIMSLLKSALAHTPKTPQDRALLQEIFLTIVRLLYPFTPHITFMLWQALGGEGTIDHAVWPNADPTALVTSVQTVIVQINGKMRTQIQTAVDATEHYVQQQAQQDPKVQPYLQGKEVLKVIYVPGKILNWVVR